MIFDDVTSALDGRTLSAISQQVFGRNGILRANGSSVVLATHALQILEHADQVFLMGKTGNFIDSGTYEQLARRHESLSQRQALGLEVSQSMESTHRTNEIETTLGDFRNELHTRVDDLSRQKGNWRSYIFYLGALGWLNFFMFALSAVFYVVFGAIFAVWLTWWAEDQSASHSLGYWLGLYATWAVLIILGMLFTPT